jgi:hypothetical protein
LHVHGIGLKEARAISRVGAESGDDGTADVIVNDVVRWNQLQFSFVAGHLVNALLIEPVARRPSSA